MLQHAGNREWEHHGLKIRRNPALNRKYPSPRRSSRWPQIDPDSARKLQPSRPVIRRDLVPRHARRQRRQQPTGMPRRDRQKDRGDDKHGVHALKVPSTPPTLEA